MNEFSVRPALSSKAQPQPQRRPQRIHQKSLHHPSVRGSSKRIWKRLHDSPVWPSISELSALDQQISEDILVVPKLMGNSLGNGEYEGKRRYNPGDTMTKLVSFMRNTRLFPEESQCRRINHDMPGRNRCLRNHNFSTKRTQTRLSHYHRDIAQSLLLT